MTIIPTQTQPKKRQHKNEEAILQSQAFVWLHNTHEETRGLFFSVLNETNPWNMSKKEQQVLGAMRKMRGVVAGISDGILLLPKGNYHFCCAEAKTTDKNSRQSEAQVTFQRNVERVGGYYFIYRTLDEFKETMEWYLNLE